MSIAKELVLGHAVILCCFKLGQAKLRVSVDLGAAGAPGAEHKQWQPSKLEVTWIGQLRQYIFPLIQAIHLT